MNNNILVIIKLNQFEDYKTCNWVKSLISLSTDFFDKRMVTNEFLLLDSKPSNVKQALNLLNEASSMDFTYNIINNDSIDNVKASLKM
jgi:hypothetical protein